MSKLSITLFKTNVITKFHSIKGFFLIGYLRKIYKIQSNTVYIKTHFIDGFNSHISTSLYLVYRCDRSSGTNHLNDSEDHSLITGVITEYKTEIMGGAEFLHRNTGVLHFWTT